VALYWTAAGLAALRPTEGGFTQIHNNVPGGATGGYGFLDSTWRAFAPQAGVDISQYPRAALAPADVQTRVAAITPISNWTCPGCNSAAVSLAQVPGYVTSTPGSADTGGSSLTSDTPGFGPGSGPDSSGNLTLGPEGLQATTPGFDPGADSSVTSQQSGDVTGGMIDPHTGLPFTGSGSAAGQGASLFNWLSTEVANLLVRFGVIILGLILLGIAAYQFAKEKEA
jgi:hypothetical protein